MFEKESLNILILAFSFVAVVFFTQLAGCNNCPIPKPHEKYCISYCIGDDVDCSCFYMSSRCVDGKWSCCYPLSHPPSEPEKFNIWYDQCVGMCRRLEKRKPNEEFCVQSEDSCSFDLSNCGGGCLYYDIHPPPMPEFEDWEARCLAKCRWE